MNLPVPLRFLLAACATFLFCSVFLSLEKRFLNITAGRCWRRKTHLVGRTSPARFVQTFPSRRVEMNFGRNAFIHTILFAAATLVSIRDQRLCGARARVR